MPEKSDTSLSNSEWLIMECLWAKAPLTVTQIVKAMAKADRLGEEHDKDSYQSYGEEGIPAI